MISLLTDNPLWDSEVFLLAAESRDELVAAAHSLVLRAETDHEDLPFASFAASQFNELGTDAMRMAVVAKNRQDLAVKLRRAIPKIEEGSPGIRDISGIYFTANPIGQPKEGFAPKVGILFPGEGSQYTGMLSDLAVLFPHVAEILEHCHDLNQNSRHQDISPALLFKRPEELDTATKEEIESLSKRIDFSVFTVFIGNWILYSLLERLAIRHDTVAGHSAGELIALMAAGVLQGSTAHFRDLGDGFRGLGKYTPPNEEESRLIALAASPQKATSLIEEACRTAGRALSCYVAMENCPRQSVIVGAKQDVEKVEQLIKQSGLMYQSLSLAQPYHTPLFEPYTKGLRAIFDPIPFHSPLMPVYSCATGLLFPSDPKRILELSLEHWEKPVRFIDLIENQYRDGVRCFIESGPRSNLSSFAEDILRGRPALIVPSNSQRLSSITQLNHLVAQLFVHHFEVDPSFLYQSRTIVEPVEDSVGENVIDAHLRVMGEFLDLQRQVMENYLTGRTDNLNLLRTNEPDLKDFPMIDAIDDYLPGKRIVARRDMSLAEDCFSRQHTVGGRELSRINPQQFGLPVVPMTFSIEMIAEAAEALIPGHQVAVMQDIKLTKWLDYHESEPSHASVVAEVTENSGDDDASITLVAKLYHWHGEAEPSRPAVVATVILRQRIPDPPVAAPLSLSNQRECQVSRDLLYKNLFHGEEFQGVTHFGRFGDNGIEAEIEVLPRPRLFESDPDPQFVFDPVLLDVALHPMCAWHLEQEDQSGRILLPIGVDRLEFFGRRPAPGKRFFSRATISRETTRQFSHEVEIVDLEEKTWCRMQGCQYWRFYLPFRQYNFHGPKDVYMLSEEWSDISPASGGKAMLLDIPSDLRNPTMQPIGARVTLSDRELNEFLHLKLSDERRTEWLFGRVAAKDAVRSLWHDMTGDRLFTADIEISHDEYGKPVASLRGRETPSHFPDVSLAHCGTKMVALAVPSGRAGVDIEKITPRESGFLKIAFNDRERLLLAELDPKMEVWVTRFWCAKEAAGKCLGRGLMDGPRSLEIVSADQQSGEVLCRLGPRMIDLAPEFADKLIRIKTVASGKFAVATTAGETMCESESKSPLNRVP